IHVDFINEDKAPGIKKGGMLTVVRPEVELSVTAGDIPEKIVVDLEGLNIGDVVTISSVDLPAGAKPTIDRDFVIANIAAPAGLASSDDEEGEEGEEAEAAAEE
ncbi:MAG: 50S ribosomal protein L25, partial [Rhodobacteraceae bacterium]|nr:50S ribosomal protein L25 [Paracoccaceae bacterium]